MALSWLGMLGPGRLLELELDDDRVLSAPAKKSAAVDLDGIEVEIYHLGGSHMGWSIFNKTADPVVLKALRLHWDDGPVTPASRAFLNGYLDSSPSTLVELNKFDHPESGSPMHLHSSSPRDWQAREFHSENFLITQRAGSSPVSFIGFDGGSSHDGGFWTKVVDGRIKTCAEATFGRTSLGPGEMRLLHGLAQRTEASPHKLIGDWLAIVNRFEKPRHGTAPILAWEFDFSATDMTADKLLAENKLPLAESHISHLICRFPVSQEPLSISAGHLAWAKALAQELQNLGIKFGLCLPLLSLDWASETNPTQIRLADSGDEILDPTVGSNLTLLEELAARLLDCGISYLRVSDSGLASQSGPFADSTFTPAERTRLVFEALRKGAGDALTLSAEGTPPLQLIGIVDECQISPGMADPALGDLMPNEDPCPPGWTNLLARAFSNGEFFTAALGAIDWVSSRADATAFWRLAQVVGCNTFFRGSIPEVIKELSNDREGVEIWRQAAYQASTGIGLDSSDLLKSAPPTQLSRGQLSYTFYQTSSDRVRNETVSGKRIVKL